MKAKTLLLLCLAAALAVLPPLFGFIALMYWLGVDPMITSLLNVVIAVVIGRLVAVPVVRKLADRLDPVGK